MLKCGIRLCSIALQKTKILYYKCNVRNVNVRTSCQTRKNRNVNMRSQLNFKNGMNNLHGLNHGHTFGIMLQNKEEDLDHTRGNLVKSKLKLSGNSSAARGRINLYTVRMVTLATPVALLNSFLANCLSEAWAAMKIAAPATDIGLRSGTISSSTALIPIWVAIFSMGNPKSK